MESTRMHCAVMDATLGALRRRQGRCHRRRQGRCHRQPSRGGAPAVAVNDQTQRSVQRISQSRGSVGGAVAVVSVGVVVAALGAEEEGGQAEEAGNGKQHGAEGEAGGVH